MEEKQKFDLYYKLMLLSVEDPSAIFDVCTRVIISMCKLNGDSQKDFDEVLENMNETFKALKGLEKFIIDNLDN